MGLEWGCAGARSVACNHPESGPVILDFGFWILDFRLARGQMNDTLLFGSWVKQRRKALDLTQLDLARFVGCSESAILKFEAGKRRPSKQIAERLATYLEIPPAEQPLFLKLARTAPGAVEMLPSPTRTHPTNLPARLTSLIGREGEISMVRDCLLGETRMVTLIGPGGIG